MLVVTVELWPFGDASRKTVLGIAKIANDGTGSPSLGNYTAEIHKGDHLSRVWKRGRVEQFRRQVLTAWDLLYLVLQDVLKGRS